MSLTTTEIVLIKELISRHLFHFPYLRNKAKSDIETCWEALSTSIIGRLPRSNLRVDEVFWGYGVMALP
jgi:hypothetical protein